MCQAVRCGCVAVFLDALQFAGVLFRAYLPYYARTRLPAASADSVQPERHSAARHRVTCSIVKTGGTRPSAQTTWYCSTERVTRVVETRLICASPMTEKIRT